MIILKIRTTVAPEKKNEFDQAIHYIIDAKLKQKIGVSRRMYQAYDDPLTYFYMEEWDLREEMTAYMGSDSYKALMGAMDFLGKVTEAQVITTSKIENILR